jgi:hypothetical protein
VTYLAKGLYLLTMSFQPTHSGLFVPPLFLDSSREARESRTLISAWMTLDETPPENVFLQLLWSAYRWRVLEDITAGQRALMILQSLDDVTLFADNPAAFQIGDGPLLVGLAHLIEMLRSHPAMTPSLIQLFRHWTETAALTTDFAPAAFWNVTARLAAGVVFEDETLFQEGVGQFQEAIAQLHPEGYVANNVAAKDENSYARQLSIACALALAAEIGTNAGIDLWGYSNRGVSAKTASAYVLYYLYYPEKWRWSESGALTAEMMKPLIKEQAAFLEIVHARSPLRTVEILLQQNRPLISFTGGGMTTLIYGAPPAVQAQKSWWQFWR